MSSESYKADRAGRESRRCDEQVQRGTGPEFCDVLLDGPGECPNAGQHLVTA